MEEYFYGGFGFYKGTVPALKRCYRVRGGVWGKIAFDTLACWNITPVFCADRFKCTEPGGMWKGIPILPPEKLTDYLAYDVLICAPSAFEEVCNQLQIYGFTKAFHILSLLKETSPKTFENLQDRLPADKLAEIYSYYMQRASGKYESLMIPQISFSITEACSLKCEKCNALMPYYQKPETFRFEQYLPEMNRMLDTVDEIMEIGFIGGEPFLNKELYKYLDWAIGSDKIVSVLIVTNSTIMPDEITIKYMKHEKVFLGLDNYGALSNKIKALEEMAIREGIQYYILKDEYWYDFGGIEKRNYTLEQRKKVFSNCPIRDCNFFMKGKLYRCQFAGNLHNLGYCNGEGDYVDFSQELSRDALRQAVSSLLTKREALWACNFCNDMEQKHLIPVAVQVKR